MRQTALYTVTDENRDKGKIFVLTEMSASQAESWAIRAGLALAKSGVELPAGFETMGMAGMAEIGIKALAGLHYELAEPLLAEMFACVQTQPDPQNPQVKRALVETDIEEVSTRLKLRAEVWKLHTGFLKAAVTLKSELPAAAQKPNV
jgi:hypothetical protein